MTEDNAELLPLSTTAESALDIAAAVSSLVPWIGGPVSVVLSGMSFSRKMERVKDVLTRMAQDIRDVEEEASRKYVHSEDFEELLEKTLRQAADERSEEKRRIYSAFLAGSIRSPGASYDEQLRILRTLEELQPDHIRLIKALLQEPALNNNDYAGSMSGTLQKRLPDMTSERVRDLAQQLTDMRVASLSNLNTMMTARGAEDLRNRITDYGRSLVRYISM
jgi:hypothetical protein